MEISSGADELASFESLYEQIERWGLDEDKQLRQCMKGFTENLILNIGKIQDSITTLDNQVRQLQVQTQTLQDRLQLTGHHVYVEQVLQETDGLDADDPHFKSTSSEMPLKSSMIQGKYAEAVQHGLKAVLTSSENEEKGFPQFYNTEAYLAGQNLSCEQLNSVVFLGSQNLSSYVNNNEVVVEDVKQQNYATTFKDMLEETVNKALGQEKESP